MSVPHVDDRPQPNDLSHYFSEITKRREASKVKAFYKYFSMPGIMNLAGGLPNPSYFPFDTLEASAAIPTRFKPTLNIPVKQPQSGQIGRKDPYLNDPTSSHVFVPHTTTEPNPLRKIDIDTALQYGTAQGYPALYAFVREFALTRLHPNVPYKNGAEVILTCGSADGFSKTIECFANAWVPTPSMPDPPVSERGAILVEEFAYMNAVQTARPKGLNIVAVAIDEEGMIAHSSDRNVRSLHRVLSGWDVQRDGSQRPHLMYTVTMGQNPTSGLLSLHRRREIYRLCQEYDIVIIEDDPYFYIQYPHAANDFSLQYRGQTVSANHYKERSTNYNVSTGGKSSGSAFLDSLVPSYLSIDVDGRVVRLDTFSKTVAQGCRLGWITAQPAVVERIQRITETTSQQPSGFAQSLLAEMLIGPVKGDKKWAGRNADGSKEEQGRGFGMEGWIRWLEGLRGNYQRRMMSMCETLEAGKMVARARSSPSSQGTSSVSDDFDIVDKIQLFDFSPPMAGMFLWLRVHYESHPCFDKMDHQLLAHAHWLHQTLPGYRVLTAPGAIFAPTDAIRDDKAWQYYRLCFAAVDEQIVQTSSRAFVKSCRDFWELSKEEIEKILEDDARTDGAAVKQLLEDERDQWMFSPLMC